MGKVSSAKQEGDRRSRIAAQRSADHRARRRNRLLLASGAIVVVVAVVLALVLLQGGNSGSTAAGPSGPTGGALTALTGQVTSVPAATFEQAGTGTVTSPPTTISGAALTSGGKPEVLYIGAEYCPYCAAERWAMVNALSRFGTFSGLKTTHSSSTDVYANTPTFTFYGSTYTSQYLTFTSVEAYGATSSTTLQTPTSAQTTQWQTYDPDGSIPFLDFGTKYVEVGNLSPLIPSMLDGKTWAQISAAMAKPTGSSLGTAEDANANYITAGICKMTNNLPATACTPTIQKLQSDFAS